MEFYMLKKAILFGLCFLMVNQTVQATTFNGTCTLPGGQMTYRIDIPWLAILTKAVKGTAYGAGAGFIIGCVASPYIMNKCFHMPVAQFKPRHRMQFGLGLAVIGAAIGFKIGLKK